MIVFAIQDIIKMDQNVYNVLKIVQNVKNKNNNVFLVNQIIENYLIVIVKMVMKYKQSQIYV